MYSVKPGRGPSLMGGIGGIVAAVFGVIWTVGATSMGAPAFFALFGVVFVLAALGGAVYNFVNAAGRNRMSTFDITTGEEESDPIADALGHTTARRTRSSRERDTDSGEEPRRFEGDFCPFCGDRVEAQFDFCPKCGKDI